MASPFDRLGWGRSFGRRPLGRGAACRVDTLVDRARVGRRCTFRSRDRRGGRTPYCPRPPLDCPPDRSQPSGTEEPADGRRGAGAEPAGRKIRLSPRDGDPRRAGSRFPKRLASGGSHNTHPLATAYGAAGAGPGGGCRPWTQRLRRSAGTGGRFSSRPGTEREPEGFPDHRRAGRHPDRTPHQPDRYGTIRRSGAGRRRIGLFKPRR